MSSELAGWFTCDGCEQNYATHSLTKIVDHVHESLWIFCVDCADDYYSRWKEVECCVIDDLEVKRDITG